MTFAYADPLPLGMRLSRANILAIRADSATMLHRACVYITRREYNWRVSISIPASVSLSYG